jgi:2-C-methyl-D-erythritol 4-phosphate cytidylyltransferase
MNAAVIVAAGRGTRFGPDRDKLFLEVGGIPIVGHAWMRFDRHPGIQEIVLVVRAGMEEAFRELAGQLRPGKPYRLTAGGAERQDSVWNGLQALDPTTSVVAVHDGARPCASARLIGDCLAAAHAHGAAVAAQPVTDTIKESTDGVSISRHLDRSRIWSVQTPQAFRVPIILKALQEVRRQQAHVTDDTAACELIGQAVRLVPSRTPNPKVTLPDDLAVIEACLARLAAGDEP